MSKVLDVNKIVEINKILKENKVEYTLHATPGCATCGVQLKAYGEKKDAEAICIIINEYLKDKWMQVVPFEKGSYYLDVQ